MDWWMGIADKSVMILWELAVRIWNTVRMTSDRQKLPYKAQDEWIESQMIIGVFFNLSQIMNAKDSFLK